MVGVFVGFSCIPLNAELNPICHFLALLGGSTIVVVSRLRVKGLIWAPFLIQIILEVLVWRDSITSVKDQVSQDLVPTFGLQWTRCPMTWYQGMGYNGPGVP